MRRLAAAMGFPVTVLERTAAFIERMRRSSASPGSKGKSPPACDGLRRRFATLDLLRQAAKQEAVTADLARRLVAYLYRAEQKPGATLRGGGVSGRPASRRRVPPRLALPIR